MARLPLKEAEIVVLAQDMAAGLVAKRRRLPGSARAGQGQTLNTVLPELRNSRSDPAPGYGVPNPSPAKNPMSQIRR